MTPRILVVPKEWIYRPGSTPYLALAQHKYRIRHREFHFAL